MKNNIRIIGLTGQTGAGKDEACSYIKKKAKNAVFLRFSSPLSEALSIFLSEIKKEDQQWLGKVLRERFGDDILAKAIEKKAKAAKKGLVVLNGIRYKEELDLLKRLGGYLISIQADPDIRWRRVYGRGEKADDKSTYEEFLKKDLAQTELQIKELSKQADFIVLNNGLKKSLYNQIDKIINAKK